MQAVHEGAQDYLIKGQVDARLLARSINYAIERKRAEVELAHQAMHDALTGLPNRALFFDRLGQALNRGGPPGHARSRCCSSTSTASSSSTTRSATAPATSCSSPSRERLAGVLRAGRHRRALRRRRVRDPLRGRQRRAPGDRDRRADRVRARRRRSSSTATRSSRTRASASRWRPSRARARGADPRRRRRDVPRQGARRRRLRGLRRRDARARGAPDGDRERAAPRARPRRVRPALPADRADGDRARSSASRRWCAGSTPSAASSCRASSSRPRRRPG